MNSGSASAGMEGLMEKYPENFTGEILRSSRVQTPEQEAAERKAREERIKRLTELAAPLVEWIRENHGPYTEVLVSWDCVSVKHEGAQIPFPYSEK